MGRTRLTAVALAVALAGGFTAVRLAADERKADPHRGHAEMEACIKECDRCAKECESCFNHCAHMVADGKKEHLKTLKTCADCADFCALASKVMARHGAFITLTCDACAKACDGCGTECEKFPNDEHMKRCGQACRDCAKACKDMVKAMGGPATRAAE